MVVFKQFVPGIRLLLFFTILTGLIYPGVLTALCQLVFPHQANGSLISDGRRIVGSSLLGQNFSRPDYFHPRPSAAGNGYDPLASGGSNLGPTNQKLIARISAAINKARKENPEYRGLVPVDMVTASASGLDPDISPAAAGIQLQRVAKMRGISIGELQKLVTKMTAWPDLGFLGEPRINVMELNLELDRQFPLRSYPTRTRSTSP
jgi:potassium-transporting ATPase KdpC subunit